jgi:hypothetical protein
MYAKNSFGGPLAVGLLVFLGSTPAMAAAITTWLGGSPRPADWAVITDATFHANGSASGLAGGTTAESSANGSNLSLVGAEWLHNGDGTRMGFAAQNTGSTAMGAGSNNGYIQYTFDQAYTIGGVKVWNQGLQYDRGTQIAQFFTTTNGVSWDAQLWTVGQNDYNGARINNGARGIGTLTPTNTDIWQFTQVPSVNALVANPATDVYSGLNWENVTGVRFAPRASYSTSGIGIGEIQFVMVPEPSTLVLLVAGMIGLAAYPWRRRR